jgi:hypothetical protein
MLPPTRHHYQQLSLSVNMALLKKEDTDVTKLVIAYEIELVQYTDSVALDQTKMKKLFKAVKKAKGDLRDMLKKDTTACDKLYREKVASRIKGKPKGKKSSTEMVSEILTVIQADTMAAHASKTKTTEGL